VVSFNLIVAEFTIVYTVVHCTLPVYFYLLSLREFSGVEGLVKHNWHTTSSPAK